MSAIRKPYGMQPRPMAEGDVSEIFAIERRAYSHPWTEGIFRDCLRAGYACTVFEQCGVIDAYAIMSLVAGECHLLNLCIRPERQGRGLGRKVLTHLLARARQYGADTVFLEVRPSNRPAVRLYTQAGFNEVGVRKRYYPSAVGREDALIMALDL